LCGVIDFGAAMTGALDPSFSMPAEEKPTLSPA